MKQVGKPVIDKVKACLYQKNLESLRRMEREVMNLKPTGELPDKIGILSIFASNHPSSTVTNESSVEDNSDDPK